MNTSFTMAASFDLFGQQHNVHRTAASFSWDAMGTQLTLNYSSLPGDAYRLTLFAGGVQDLVGHPLTGDFTIDFAVLPVITSAVPTVSGTGLLGVALLLGAVAWWRLWRRVGP